MSGNRGPNRSSFGPRKRIDTHQVEMIADHHQRALRQLNVDPAGGIGQHQRLDAKQLKRANGKRDFFERVTFVVMHAALHRDHGNLSTLPITSRPA